MLFDELTRCLLKIIKRKVLLVTTVTYTEYARGNITVISIISFYHKQIFLCDLGHNKNYNHMLKSQWCWCRMNQDTPVTMTHFQHKDKRYPHNNVRV